MTWFDIQSRIDSIAKLRGDAETAHAEEDRLRADFLRFLAEHDQVPNELREMALLVLSTEKIEFERWCA